MKWFLQVDFFYTGKMQYTFDDGISLKNIFTQKRGKKLVKTQVQYNLRSLCVLS